MQHPSKIQTKQCPPNTGIMLHFFVKVKFDNPIFKNNFMKTSLLFAIAFFGVTVSSFSQNNFWKTVAPNQVSNFTKGKPLFSDSFKPSVYNLFTLDETAFNTVLKQSPHQINIKVTSSNFIISIPVSDGNIENFRIVESPVMSAQLQAKHPEIRTYLGQGVDDPSSTIRFDFTALGFHAVIISPKRKTIYINPVSSAKQLYVVFDRNNISGEKQVFDCQVDKVLNSDIQGVEKPFTTSDGNLRTFRFAVASGAEFSQLCLTGDETTDEEKKLSVLSVLVTDLIRTDIIFETDFGIHLNYVDNEDTIIFLDGANDPFLSNASGYSSGKWNKQSQIALDSLIGTSNYDIGHLLMGYDTGGNAGCIGCVCNKPNKGSGVTGFKTNLTDDPFIVDFWDHEIGHQFGGNHTFDFSFEGTIAQMEPGSGSTIMGYAGVTGSTDIQQHSDPYFHAISIQQIEDYITAGRGATCAVVSETGDAVPAASAGNDYTIPKSTPFKLTATASDSDAADVLTYCWEQFDNFKNNGTSYKFPKATSTTGPVFRSVTPSLLPDRTFPSLTSILNGSNANKWEVLPSVARTLNFRLTVRDNHPGGSNTNSDDVAVTVDETSGPFKVTYPDESGILIGSGATAAVKWDVASTNAAPVNCTKVNILLSIDGGFTFPYLLAANTPNDGSQNVTFPIFQTIITTARLKIEASANIFFDISDADFSIQGALPLSWASFSAERSGDFNALLKWSTANEINNDHFEIERSKDAVSFASLTNVASGKNSNTVQNYNYTDIHIPVGTSYYRIKQVDKDGRFSYTKIAQVTLDKNGLSWSVMPNPATDHSTLIFNENASDVHIYLTDASGKMIYKNIFPSVVAGRQLTIPFNNLAKGVYILRVETGDKVRSEKIIKN